MFKNSEWKKVNFSDVVSINPRESLKKGTLAKKVAMSNITEHTKKIYSYDMVMVSKLHNFKHLNKMKCSKV